MFHFYFIRGNYLCHSHFHKISFSKNPYQPRVTRGSEPTFGPHGNRSSPQPEPSAKGKDRTIEETPVPLEGRQQKPTTLWAFQVERFRWRQSRGVHMVLENHWYHAYEIYKCSYHLDSTIPRGSVTLLLLGIAIFRGSVSFVRGVESKALDNSLPRYYFHKEVSTTNRLSIHVLKPTFNVANHLNAWEAARYQWTFMLLFRRQSGGQSWEYWRSHLPFFNFIGVLSTLKMGKSNKPPDQPSPFWKFYFQHVCRLPFSSHISYFKQILNYFIDAVMNPHPASSSHNIIDWDCWLRWLLHLLFLDKIWPTILGELAKHCNERYDIYHVNWFETYFS